jgi:hypothetical protein
MSLEEEKERRSKKFSSLVGKGKLSAALRFATQDETVKVLDPTYTYNRDDQKQTTVARELKAKNPEAKGLDRSLATEFVRAVNEGGLLIPEPITLTADDVERQAKHLSGAAGLSGVDAQSLTRMLLQHGTASQKYREAIARYTSVKASQLVDFSKLEVMRAGRGLPLCEMAKMKLRGIVVGEVEERLGSKAIMAKTRHEATSACAAHQVCVGIKGGPEGLAHCVDAVFGQPESEIQHEDVFGGGGWGGSEGEGESQRKENECRRDSTRSQRETAQQSQKQQQR